MATSKSRCKREMVSSSAPRNFVQETKLLLKEIEEYRGRVHRCFRHDINKEISSAQNKEYYSIIDTTVKDRDALEGLRLRQMLRESLKATEVEVQDQVKKLLSIEADCPKILVDDQVLNSDHSVQRQSTSSVELKKFPTPRKHRPPPTKSCSPHQYQPMRNRSQNADASNFTAQTLHHKQVSKVTNLPTKDCYKVSQSKSCVAPKVTQTNSVESNERASVIFSKEFMAKASGICPSLVTETHCLANKGKYLPCAVPLADPSRKRIEVPSNFGNAEVDLTFPKTTSISTTNANVLVVNIDAERCRRPQLVDQRLPSMDIKGKPFRPVIRNNTQLILVKDEESPTEKVDEAIQVTAEEHLVTNPVTHAAVEPLNRVEEDTIAETSSCDKSTMNTRLNASLLSELISALRRSQKEIQPENVETSNQNTLQTPRMNIIADDPSYTQFNNLNTNKEKATIGIQADDESLQKLVPQMVSESVQVSLTRPCIEKCQQTDVEQRVLTEHSAQTDLQGQLGNELVIKQRNIDLRPSCSTQCNIPSPLPETVRTSTPISEAGLEIKNLEPAMYDFLPENEEREYTRKDGLRKAETKDVGTQCFAEMECQTLPEMSNIGMQTESGVEYVSDCTMTTQIKSCDVSVQISLDSQLHNLPDKQQGNQNAKKEIGIQSDLLEVSTSSATVSNGTNVSDSEFVDDLLSEGEVPLPWNLRLLSLFDKTSGFRNEQSSVLCGESENLLSEGEIPPMVLQQIQRALSPRINDLTATVLPSSSDPSSDLTSGKPSFSQKFLSDGQIPNVSSDVVSEQLSSSDLLQPSTSEDQTFSLGEIVTSDELEASFSEFPVRKTLSCHSDHGTCIPESIAFVPSNVSVAEENKTQVVPDNVSGPAVKEAYSFYATLPNFFSGSSDKVKNTLTSKRNEPEFGSTAGSTITRLDIITRQSEKVVSRAPDLNTVIEENSTGSSGSSLTSVEIPESHGSVSPTQLEDTEKENKLGLYNNSKILVSGEND